MLGNQLDPPTHGFADRMAGIEGSAIRAALKLADPHLISFSGGFPAEETFDVPGLELAVQEALRMNSRAALQYGVTEGLSGLREALAELTWERGAQVRLEDLLITAGAQQGIDLLGKILVNPGDTVLVERPTYLSALQIFKLHQARLVDLHTDEHGVDVNTLEYEMRVHRPKLLYLVPTFSNPSGAVLGLDRRRRILELAVQHQVLVVEDDPYGELRFDDDVPPPLLALADAVPGARDWVVYLSSLSKILAPGLRVGWMVAPAAVLERAVVAKQGADAHTSSLSQVTALHYLRSGRLPAHLVHVRETYRERAALLTAALREWPPDLFSFRPPRGGMFLWGQLGHDLDASRVAQEALGAGVTFVPGAPFYAHAPDRSTLRLSYAFPRKDALSEGAARLGSVLSRQLTPR